MLLVLVEHDRGTLADATLEAVTAARGLADRLGLLVHAAVLVGDANANANADAGEVAEPLAHAMAHHGVATTHVVRHALLADYGPEAWGEALAQLADAASASVVMATGTDRGNEVLAQMATRRGLPMVANCLEIEPGGAADEPWRVVRTRWGGSLLEEATIAAPVKVLTVAHHAIEARPPEAPEPLHTEEFVPTLDPALARTMVRDRVVRTAGVTLGTARVVVSGGRGVGSAEGFAPLEDLATLLGGVVGCSRAVTNNGWRNHTDQVGQTGTRIAPDIYIACGISGAIQHWVGAMASKKILAINTDREANMVAKADYAVIGDLHQVVPAIAAEIRRRQPG